VASEYSATRACEKSQLIHVFSSQAPTSDTGWWQIGLGWGIRVTGMGPDQRSFTMSQNAQAVARRTGYAMLAPLIVGLPAALFAGGIDIPIFSAVAMLWLVVSLVLIIGPESISEVSFWEASIKRDAAAAKSAREEAEAIRDELKKVARLSVENVFLLNSLTAGVYTQYGSGNLPPAFAHVTKNLEEMTPLISTDAALVAAWQEEMRKVIRAG
jgi:hypothetical protein